MPNPRPSKDRRLQVTATRFADHAGDYLEAIVNAGVKDVMVEHLYRVTVRPGRSDYERAREAVRALKAAKRESALES
jgi:hypothetical protein